MRRSITIAMLALVVAACDQAAEPELTTTTTTTTTVASSTTTLAPTTTTDTAADGAADGASVDAFDVVVRSDSEHGPVLWVVVPPAAYGDVDLEQFVTRLVEEEDGVWEIHVFDDPAALEAGRLAEEDRTDAEQALVEEHHLISLTEGVVLTYHGPYEDTPGFVLGS